MAEQFCITGTDESGLLIFDLTTKVRSSVAKDLLAAMEDSYGSGPLSSWWPKIQLAIRAGNRDEVPEHLRKSVQDWLFVFRTDLGLLREIMRRKIVIRQAPVTAKYPHFELGVITKDWTAMGDVDCDVGEFMRGAEASARMSDPKDNAPRE